MPQIKEPGRYDVTVTSAEFGESKTGTPFVSISVATEDGETITGWLYFSEKALPNSVNTLRNAFQFDGNFEKLIEQIQGKECSVTCDLEADDKGNERLRVKWINARSNTRPISDQANFLRSLTQQAARIPLKAGSAAPKAAPAKPAQKVAPKAAPAGTEPF